MRELFLRIPSFAFPTFLRHNERELLMVNETRCGGLPTFNRIEENDRRPGIAVTVKTKMNVMWAPNLALGFKVEATRQQRHVRRVATVLALHDVRA